MIKDLFHCIIDGKMCLFMTQYATTLQKIIQKKLDTDEPFNESEICSISKKIILGIQFLHKNEIIHRDIKVRRYFLKYLNLCNCIGSNIFFFVARKYLLYSFSLWSIK